MCDLKNWNNFEMFKKGQKCYSEKNEKLKLGKKEKQKEEVCRKGFDVLFLENKFEMKMLLITHFLQF